LSPAKQNCISRSAINHHLKVLFLALCETSQSRSRYFYEQSHDKANQAPPAAVIASSVALSKPPPACRRHFIPRNDGGRCGCVNV